MGSRLYSDVKEGVAAAEGTWRPSISFDWTPREVWSERGQEMPYIIIINNVITTTIT